MIKTRYYLLADPRWSRRLACTLLVCWVGCSAAGCAPNRSRDVEGKGAPAEQNRVGRARVEFEEVFADWKEMLGELRDLELAFHTSGREDREALAQQYYQKLADGYELENELQNGAMRTFVADPEANEDLKAFLIQISSLLARAECYEDALRVLQLLLENQVEDGRVLQNAAEASFACSEFALAEQCTRMLQKQRGRSDEDAQRLKLIEQYKVEWEKELDLRETESIAGDLPRVVLVTVRGEIELELFENEAPNTVANFIGLVEDSFYDGMVFHEVTPKFAAHTGCPLEDGSGSPGFFIRHEFNKPNRRVHFRGSLSTVEEGPVANGSQFRLTFVPTPALERRCTVFGRVVRGMDVLARLQRRSLDGMSSLARADSIYMAKVVSKRDHPYKPDRIPDPTAKERAEKAMRMRKLLSR